MSTTFDTLLPCLDCQRPLSDGTLHPDYPAMVECACGIRYSTELLEAAHAEQWAYITLRRLFCRRCNGRWHAPVVHADADGRPIPCPKHGPEPA